MTISNIGTEIANNAHPVWCNRTPTLAGDTVLVVISDSKFGVKCKEIDKMEKQKEAQEMRHFVSI